MGLLSLKQNLDLLVGVKFISALYYIPKQKEMSVYSINKADRLTLNKKKYVNFWKNYPKLYLVLYLSSLQKRFMGPNCIFKIEN